MHVAIIMDGNGRWAERRGLNRTVGHRAGAKAVRKVTEAAVRAGVDVMTLYAFSSANWSRPAEEVQSLMWLLKRHLQSEVARCVENGVRIDVIGRRDRLGSDLVGIIERAENVTAHGQRLILRLAVDYSARATIARAAELKLDERAASHEAEPEDRFAARIAAAMHSSVAAPSVDLLIRTGGERRLSDFLLFECAYAELLFVNQCWPDFDDRSFSNALQEFARRERRFGGLPQRQATRRAARFVGDSH